MCPCRVCVCDLLLGGCVGFGWSAELDKREPLDGPVLQVGTDRERDVRSGKANFWHRRGGTF